MLRPADEFFFIAHDLRTGKPHLPQRTTGFGLAGALIAPDHPPVCDPDVAKRLLAVGWATVERGLPFEG